jgi:hypothetical protein
MIQVGGFDLLFGWSGFVLLLVMLAAFVLRAHPDVFDEADRPAQDLPGFARPTNSRPENKEAALRDARLRSPAQARDGGDPEH